VLLLLFALGDKRRSALIGVPGASAWASHIFCTEMNEQGFAPLPLPVHLEQEDKIKPSHPGYASY
jgi:hypothetical protein